MNRAAADVTVTVKLSQDQVEWLDRRVDELRRADGPRARRALLGMPAGRRALATRSTVVRQLVAIALERERIPRTRKKM